MKLATHLTLLTLVLGVLLVAEDREVSGQVPPFEVWVLDQADSAVGGNRLYIYQSSSFAGASFSGEPEVIDLQRAATGVGHGPGTRPHMMLFNPSWTHGIIANVASGHVQFIRASDRRITASIDVGDQAHMAMPTSDEALVIVANQNGKKLARITTDYRADRFSHNPEHDLDLRALETNNLPDNAPICPVLVRNSKKAYVTLRGGGLLVVDTGSTPMRVLKSFTNHEVFGNGCGGVQVGNKMYINSGTAVASHLYTFDVGSDTLVSKVVLPNVGTDAHGMLLAGNGRYAWMANRGDGNNIVVIDTGTDTAVSVLTGIGDAPDLMELSPDGSWAFLTLRGPKALTGGPSAVGSTPGFAVLRVTEAGRSGSRQMFVPIGDQTSNSNVDPHGIGVRPKIEAPVAPIATPLVRPPQTGNGGLLEPLSTRERPNRTE